MEKIINNISDEKIESMGNKSTWIHCDECDYETDMEHMSEAVFRINMQGGYFMFDGVGGAITLCPSCGNDSLRESS